MAVAKWSRLMRQSAFVALLSLAIFAYSTTPTAQAADADYLYKFPCEPDVSCYVTQGLHGSSGYAIDFDIAGGGTSGTVLAMSEGTVDFRVDDNDCTYPNTPQSRGIYAVIDDSSRSTTYAHLDSTISNPDYPTVLQGDPIGIEGDTGYTYRQDGNGNVIPCGVHLHWDPAASVKIENISTSNLCAICNYTSTNSWVGDPTESASAETAIRNTFQALGGWADIGWTVDAGGGRSNPLFPHSWPLTNPCGTEQNFKRDGGSNPGISGIYASGANPTAAYWVPPDYADLWWGMSSPKDLGCPTSNKTTTCPASAPPNCSAYQQFERGYIWTGPSGTAIVQRPTLFTITTTTSTTPYLRLNDGAGAWSATGDTSQGDEPTRLRYFGGGLMFHMTEENTGNGFGSLRRSTNFGETWTALSAPSGADQILDVTRAPNGDLWALWADNSCCTPYKLKVYKSSDEGDSWTLVLDAGAAWGYSIAVNPGDGNYVAFTQKSSTKLQVRASSNGGSSSTSAAQVSNNLSPSSKGLAWNGSTRLVVLSQATNHTAIYTSDSSPWSSWTARIDLALSDEWKQLAVAGDVMFALRYGVSDGVMVHRSTDGGVTWEGIKRINYGLSTEVSLARGLAYDSEADVLYVAYQSLGSGGTTNVARLAEASTVDASTAHEDWDILADPNGDINRDQRLVVITDVP